MVLDATIRDPMPVGPMADAVFDARSDQYITTQGVDHFLQHPQGEGEGRVNWLCTKCGLEGTRHFQPDAPSSCPDCGGAEFLRGPQFYVVRGPAGELKPECFVEDESRLNGYAEIIPGVFKDINPFTGRWEISYCRDEDGEIILDEPKRVEVTRRQYRKKLDTSRLGIPAAERASETDSLENLHYRAKIEVVETSTEEFDAETRYYDTGRNSIVTVGTGKTHATIAAAISAASSGDIIEVYAGGVANVYTGAIADGGKQLQIIGMVADQGLTIAAGAGNVTSLTGGGGALVNFEIDGTGGGAVGCSLSGSNARLDRCLIHDCTTGVNVTGVGFPQNCIAYDCTTGFQGNNALRVFLMCTAVDCTTGFFGTAANRFTAILCLGSDNGTDFSNADATKCFLNCSSDATAPGAGASVSTFTNADFTNYAGNDFTLGTTSTAAKFDGYPTHGRYDFANGLRKWGTTGGNYVYAGASDPDPSTPDFPDRVNVLDTDTVQDQAGRWAAATAAQGVKDAQWGVDGTGVTGTDESTDPGVANVRDGTTYKINSVDKEGTLEIDIPAAPTIGTITASGVTVTIPITGVDTACYVYIRDKDGTSLVDNSGDPLLADGDQVLTLPSLDVFTMIEARNKTTDSWGPADIVWRFFGSDSTTNEILAYVIDLLQADSALVDLLASANDMFRVGQERQASFPQLTFDIKDDPDRDLDDSPNKPTVTLEVMAWAWDEDTLAKIVERVDAVLYDNRRYETSNWIVAATRRVNLGFPAEPGFVKNSTAKQLRVVPMTYELRARKK